MKQDEEIEGERLRSELVEWLTKNKIVSISLETSIGHDVEIQSKRLPDNIKPVLTRYGCIYVEDSDAEKPF